MFTVTYHVKYENLVFPTQKVGNAGGRPLFSWMLYIGSVIRVAKLGRVKGCDSHCT